VGAGTLLPVGDGSVAGSFFVVLYGLLLGFTALGYCYCRFGAPSELKLRTKEEPSGSNSVPINYEPDKEGTTLVTFSDLSDGEEEQKEKDRNLDAIENPFPLIADGDMEKPSGSLSQFPRTYSFSLSPSPPETAYLRDDDVELDR